MNYPFDTSGIEGGAGGPRRYRSLPQNLVQTLRRAVDRHPAGEALVELGGDRVTYTQLWDRAARVAGGLRDAGVRPGDRVALRLPNGIDWALAFWGTVLAGAVVVPVNFRFAPEELAYVLEDSGAGYVVEPEVPLPYGNPLAVEDQGRDDLAGIFYTSGTTGFPKGAMTTHDNFLSSVENVIRCAQLDRTEVWRTLISVPLFHVTGCDTQLLTMAGVAGTSVLMPAFHVKQFLRAIPGERVSFLVTVPAIYWLAMHQAEFAGTDVSTVRSLSYGGAPIAPDLVTRIQENFPRARVGNGFGLTETASVATYLPHEQAAGHADSVGFPVPVVDVRVASPDPATGAGELLIRGPNVVAGYWRKPQQTAETFVDGWLHSGDIARVDDDGLVYIVDRLKDMINRGGENVYCIEVENVLGAHLAVGEVAVVGVPDVMMGEKVGAVVVLQPGHTVEPHELVTFAARHLADFEVPQYLVVRSEPLPKNPGGKILKALLREQTEWGKPLR
ncbi:MAG TPA: AMP-binding protein [Streptosporangiaceae bacterium]|nr:AMP-binding protein [Streptosporangiaceae bacterium]